MPMIVTVLGNQNVFFFIFMLVYYIIIITELYSSLHYLHAYLLDTFDIKISWWFLWGSSILIWEYSFHHIVVFMLYIIKKMIHWSIDRLTDWLDSVFSIGTAFVQDLIGLIMYKYTNQGLEPELKVLRTLHIRHCQLWWQTSHQKFCYWVLRECTCTFINRGNYLL